VQRLAKYFRLSQHRQSQAPEKGVAMDERETPGRSTAPADCGRFVEHCDRDTTNVGIAIRVARQRLWPTILIGRNLAACDEPLTSAPRSRLQTSVHGDRRELNPRDGLRDLRRPFSDCDISSLESGLGFHRVVRRSLESTDLPRRSKEYMTGRFEAIPLSQWDRQPKGERFSDSVNNAKH
jgi:hypothetical protein